MGIDLPQNWKYLNFEKCINKVSISSSLKIPKRDYHIEGDIPIIDQGKDFIAGYCSDKTEVFENVPVIIFGDHTCIFKYVDFPFLLGADGTKIISPKTEILLPKYFYYYLKSLKLENQGYSRHYKFLKEKFIVIPPINIQKKIIEKLENVEKLIAYKTESIGLLDSYLKSVFFDMFGDIISNSKNWNMGLLEDIALFKTKSMNPIDFDKNWYYVGLENIESQKDSFSNLSLVADNEIKSSKYYFNQDVVLYGKLRPYLNKVALPNFEGICSTDIIPILPKENSNKYFIRFLLSHEYYVNLSTQKSTGANLPRVSPTKLRKFEIPIPPIEIQNQFAKIVQQVDETKKYQLESKKELENLFNNLMQKAFKGELIC